MAFNLDEAGIISTSLQAMLYGFAVLMYLITLWLLLRKRSSKKPQYLIVGAATLLIVLATMEMITNIVRLGQGFITVGPNLPGGRIQYFASVSTTTFVLKSCLYNAQTLVLDAVLIYRVYVVWQSVYIIIFPSLCWLGLLATSIGLNISLVTAPPANDADVFAPSTARWIQALYGLTIASNFIATALLAFRIWSIDRQAAAYRSGGILRPLLTTIFESGLIYSVTITAALITFAIKSIGVYVVLDMISPIISIVFNMLIIRIGHFNLVTSIRQEVGAGINITDREHGLKHTTTIGSAPAFNHRFGKGTRTGSSHGYEMKALEVQITKEHDSDASSMYEKGGRSVGGDNRGGRGGRGGMSRSGDDDFLQLGGGPES